MSVLNMGPAEVVEEIEGNPRRKRVKYVKREKKIDDKTKLKVVPVALKGSPAAQAFKREHDAGNHDRLCAKRLERRRADYDKTVAGRAGFKRPGSMRPKG